MNSAPARGRFITLEGGEGAGKSTLARRLAAALRGHGLDVALTREPGGSPGANAIRALLVRPDAPVLSARAETLLFAAARVDHMEKTILPALARGEIVICDRFSDSTRAYQVAGRGLPRAEFDALHRWTRAPTPDLTLILDVDPARGLIRSGGAAAGEDRFEALGLEFHTRVRTEFLSIAAEDSARCVVIDSLQAAESVFEQALAAIDARWKTA